MNEFLKMLVQNQKDNNKLLSSNEIYNMLKYYNIEENNSLSNDINKFYKEFLNSLDNSLVKYETRNMKYTHYISFYTDKKANYLKAVKVYFPVKYEYLMSSLKTVFMYLIRNNIASTVKFHINDSNEAIVIRFYNEEDVLPFINYCNNNFILKELLYNLNPFIASLYGIGVIKDDNTTYSFNTLLSELISDYFNVLGEFLDKACDLDFLDYLRKKESIEENDVIKFDINEIIKSIMCILNNWNPLENK